MMTYDEDIIKIRKKFMYSYKKGNFISSIIIGQKLIALYKKNEDILNMDYADDLYNLASAYYETGSYAQAKSFYIDSIKVVKKIVGRGLSYAERLNNIALSCAKIGEYENAVKYLNDTISILSEIGYENTKFYLDSFYNLANIHYDMGEYDKAIRLHITVLFTRNDEGDAYADSLNCIGFAYEKQGDLENSINYLKRATMYIKRVYGVNSDEYLSNIYYMAHIYSKKQDYKLAIKSYEEARRIISKLYNDKHPYYADTLNRLSEALLADEQVDKALKMRLKALKIVKEQIGENHVYYANSLRNVALMYKSNGQDDKAIEFFTKALKIKNSIIGAGNIDYIRDVMLLSGMLIEKYDYDKVIVLLNETIEALKKEDGEFSNIITEIDKIFHSIKSIKEIKDSYNQDMKKQDDKLDIFELLKLVEDKIAKDDMFGNLGS